MGHICQTGWMHKPGVDTLTSPTEQRCCQASCATVTCPHGYISFKGSSSLSGQDTESCCFRAKYLSAGYVGVFCGIQLSDNTAHCWGDCENGHGQCDIPTGLGAVRDINVGFAHVCAAKVVDGQMRCWGKDLYGETTVPVTVGVVKMMALGRHCSCAVSASDGAV